MNSLASAVPYGPILNLYPDSLGSSLCNAADFLELPETEGVFSSLYILPSLFHSDLDRGFSIIDYGLNEALATGQDLARIRKSGVKLILDFVINHASVQSPQFRDILEKGDDSVYRDFFIDWNRFWSGRGQMNPEGYITPDPEVIKGMYFRKPGLPVLMVRFPDGRSVPFWNTFYQEIIYPAMDTTALADALQIPLSQASELAGMINQALEQGLKPHDISLEHYEQYRQQIIDLLESRRRYLGQMDLNIRSPLVWSYYRETLKTLAGYGAAIVRLDAFAYASKEAGARNFLNEPGTWDLLREIQSLAAPDHLALLPEVHASYDEKLCDRLAEAGCLCYDFFLPGLVLDALEHGTGEYLIRWAMELHEKGICAVNMLGCHDGIPLLDLKGLLPEGRISSLIDQVVARGGMVKNLHGQKEAYYQVNATYFSALGEDESKLLLSRALQLFMPGIPQIWYLDLFAGKNDHLAVTRHGSSGHKEINRTNLSREYVRAGLDLPLVRDQLKMIRFRGSFAAFHPDAAFDADEPSPGTVRFVWRHQGCSAALQADLKTGSFTMTGSGASGDIVFAYSQSSS